MVTNHVTQAEEYYKLVGNKNVEGIKKCLHSDVELHSPLAVVKGKEAVVNATSNFMNSFKSLMIRNKFGVDDQQAIVIYDVDIPGIAKDFAGVSLLNFREGLIVRIQLFYDGKRIVEKREEIFSNS